jgi:Partial alpha/beta-hydrolase lipase region
MIADTDLLARTDFHVLTSDGFLIAVREIRVSPSEPRKTPVILVHGLRVPGIASFDLPVPGGSLAADLANSGAGPKTVKHWPLIWIMQSRSAF